MRGREKEVMRGGEEEVMRGGEERCGGSYARERVIRVEGVQD